ncbi:predicted protein [Uncinocarpus reesii 1704]|uniref:Uncharacterized protein n=1 Tax=Uncinocarpus reesii (strain UAMH 1704) TaxID=336963 RepID=C4JPH8_UNCRE|nr:uncharacterized protein UREG_03150 [Uncinocarpus reesii 1704]EEP78304.1 predicted protein [Uncinocarpus reesii 1704]
MIERYGMPLLCRRANIVLPTNFGYGSTSPRWASTVDNWFGFKGCSTRNCAVPSREPAFERLKETVRLKNRRHYNVNLLNMPEFSTASRPYPSRGSLFSSERHWEYQLFRYHRLGNLHCRFTSVISDPVDYHNSQFIVPKEAESEHLIPLSLHVRFIEAANRGWLRGNRTGARATRAPPVDSVILRTLYFNGNTLHFDLKPVTRFSSNFRSPAERVWEAYGSNTNRETIVLAERDINTAKMTVFGLQNSCGDGKHLPFSDDRVSMLDIPNYELIGRRIPELRYLEDHWDEFYDDYMTEIEDYNRKYLNDRIAMIRDAIHGLSNRCAAMVRRSLNLLEDDIQPVFHEEGSMIIAAGLERNRCPEHYWSLPVVTGPVLLFSFLEWFFAAVTLQSPDVDSVSGTLNEGCFKKPHVYTLLLGN